MAPRYAPGRDGRSVRWRSHLAQRRAAIVAATVEAIDRCGPDVSTERIAAQAGIHRTVLYRYFADRKDLSDSVAAAVADAIRSNVLAQLEIGEAATPRQIISATVSALIDRVVVHRTLFLFLLAHGGDARLADVRAAVIDRLASILGDVAARAHVVTDLAEPTAHGVIGLVESTLSWWIRNAQNSREYVVEMLTASIWYLLDGIARDNGIDIAFDGPVTVAH